MATPFAAKWEVSSLRWNHGSFVEAAKVKPLQDQRPGDWWVERPVAGLKQQHLERIRRRWWLASQLSSPAWPALLDAGEDGDEWVVIESPGRRMDGTFPFSNPQSALNAMRGLALGVSEAESLLLGACTSPHLSIRAANLGTDENGRLHFHLAALDAECDAGFPSTPAMWMWSPEELFGQPETARTNVFMLAWLGTLMLTGRSPWGSPGDGHTENQRREALKPLIAQGKLQLQLPEAAKAVEPILRRALSFHAPQRYANAFALADALSAVAPGNPTPRPPCDVRLELPKMDPRFETLTPHLESRLLNATDESVTWSELAQLLDVTQSPRAKLLRGDESVKAELTPAIAGEKLTMTWRKGYVRAMTVEPAVGGNKVTTTGEARLLELTALLQHPSFRFLSELTLAGPLPHARVWLEVLQRFAPVGLKRVTTNSVAATDQIATDISFRFPKWTWVWGTATSGGFFKKLFGK
ncbi:MAG: hypothetical protein JNM17_25325 [Archangium sp.]|nr:hypothetical protein [Archangium sp.]